MAVGDTAKRAETIPRDRMVKPIDAWWTVVFVDPIATRVVPALARVRWVSPTRITIVAHALGMVSAILFVQGHLAIAAAVFEVRFLADCIDGKLARATGRSSMLGQLLDAFGDRVLVVANVAALGWSHSPVATLLFAASYPLQFHLLETRSSLFAAGEARKASERMADTGPGAWMARHRLYPIPTSVDVEHLLLVVAPLAWAIGIDLVGGLLWLVTVYFIVQGLRYGASLLRLAATVDRTSRTTAAK